MEITNNILDSKLKKYSFFFLMLSAMMYIFAIAYTAHIADRIFTGILGAPESELLAPATLELISDIFPLLNAITTARLFQSAYKTTSLFTDAQSRRVLRISLFFMLSFAFNLLSQAILISLAQHSNSFYILFSSFSFNCNELLGSIVCFGLGLIFRYASLLQSVSDETV